jgi:hypothetical protein
MPPHQFKCYYRAIKTKKNTTTISNEQAEVNQMKGSLFPNNLCVYLNLEIEEYIGNKGRELNTPVPMTDMRDPMRPANSTW